MFNRRKRRKAIPVNNIAHLRDLASEGKPVLVDFWQTGCGPCRIMDGIVDEIADEYGETAHVVKVDVGRAQGAVSEFGIRSTPTFLVLSGDGGAKLRPRWRQSGLVKKDQLGKVLEREGAVRVDA